jgi:hypothetical protein
MTTAMRFQKYMSDGPGFHGSFEIQIDGNSVRQTLDTKEPSPPNVGTLPYPLTIVESRAPTFEDLQSIWHVLDKEDRENFEVPGNIDTNRVRVFTTAAGNEGAILIGGSVSIVAAAIFGDPDSVYWVELTPEEPKPAPQPKSRLAMR